MKKVYKLFCLALTVLLFSSCRKEVKTDDSLLTAYPVINSIIINGKPIKVHISIASQFSDTKTILIENATVKLYRENVLVEDLIYINDGIYISESIGEASKEYSLRINVPGYKEINCKTTVPVVPEISNVKFIPIAGMDNEGETYSGITFDFKTTPTIAQYFEICLKVFYYGNIIEVNPVDIVDPILLHEGLPLPVFSNEIIKDSLYSMRYNYYTGVTDNNLPLILEFRSISKEYYLYLRQKYLYDTGRFPEFGLNSSTAFPMYSNIDEGYGIFAGYSFIVSDTIQP